jgi:cobalt/nickel transport system permease protein
MTLALRHGPVPPSPVARWDVRWKLAGMGFFALTAAFVRTPSMAALFFTVAVILAGLSRLSGRTLLTILATLLALSSPWLVALPLLAEDGWQAGLIQAGTILFRTMAIGTTVWIVMATARPDRTFAAARNLGVPAFAVHLLQFAYRYAFLLMSETRRMLIAMAARGGSLRTESFRTIGHLAGNVLVRGGTRAEVVSQAMSCRGFDGRYPTLNRFQAGFTDALGFAAIVTVSLILTIGDRLG